MLFNRSSDYPLDYQTGEKTWSYKSKHLVDLHAQLASLNVDTEYKVH